MFFDRSQGDMVVNTGIWLKVVNTRLKKLSEQKDSFGPKLEKIKSQLCKPTALIQN